MKLFSKEWFEYQGSLKISVYCEDCEYETEVMEMKDLTLKLSLEGGYLISDKSGGYFSRCPKCGSEKLTLEND